GEVVRGEDGLVVGEADEAAPLVAGRQVEVLQAEDEDAGQRVDDGRGQHEQGREHEYGSQVALVSADRAPSPLRDPAAQGARSGRGYLAQRRLISVWAQDAVCAPPQLSMTAWLTIWV